MTKPTIFGGTVLAAAISVSALSAQAEETLIMSTLNAPQAPINSMFFDDWAAAINEAGAGEVSIDLRHGQTIASHTNFADRLDANVTQVTWGMSIFAANQFPKTLVSTLPFLVENSTQGSVALWDMYEAGVFESELGDYKVLAMTLYPQSGIHTNAKSVASIDDVDGLKLISTTPTGSAILAEYGAAPQSFPIPQWYEVLQRGGADGFMVNFTAFPAFGLSDVATDHYVIPMGGAMGMVMMTKDKWNDLSPEAQAAIEANSGREASRKLGQVWDTLEAKIRGDFEASADHNVVVASAEDVQALKDLHFGGVAQGFVGRTPDGQAVIDAFIEALGANLTN